MSQVYQLSDRPEKLLLALCQRSDRATLIYFYPKDMTVGCTQQAVQFRDHIDWFHERGIEVIGVSRDSVVRHKQFIAKYALSFPLIADKNSLLCQKFAVMAEKSMYGRTYLGIVRSTFLLDQNANIVHAWRDVRIVDHLNEIMLYIDGWMNESS